MLAPPSAALSCETTDDMPPEKSTPITLSFGSIVAVSFSGNAFGSSTRMIETLR
ncbi:Uncharacterised protein [Mycobacterium tuberculosis]|nr:Uncharacterised protein [Mycobacterium tuberculosis]